MQPQSFLKFIGNYTGLLLGLVIFFIVLNIPAGYIPASAQKMAAITVLMAIWWVTEAIPIPATALIPIFLFPIFKIMNTASVTVNYGHHLVFLFLGGFIIALAIERWSLHKRIALYIISILGTNPRKIILGFMLATAFLSMWISNTATTMMMIPIGLAIISQVKPDKQEEETNCKNNSMGLALMLGIAYSASIGGITTLIGTPPNIVFIGILKSNFPGAPEISFVQWMLFVTPFVIIFLPLSWIYLVYIAVPLKGSDKKHKQRNVIRHEIAMLGPISRQEIKILIIFILTAILWIFRTDINLDYIYIPGWAGALGINSYVHDSTVAVAMALLTFIVPAGKTENGKTKFLMDWSCAKKIPWGILLLFGGGFALADGFQQSGLTEWLGNQFSSLQHLPLLFIIIAICATTTFTTEFTSNTAMASTILPIIASLAIAIGLNPLVLMLPVTISCSTAFMLPVATPPNAIVFGSGLIKIKDMVRIGLVMNIIGLILVILILYINAVNIFDINWYEIPLWAK